jgi:DNA uptake protein ComE-like DNA-binding protein
MERGILAARDATAQARIMSAAAQLGARFGLDEQAERVASATARDALVRNLFQREAVADLLEAVVAASEPMSDDPAGELEAMGLEPSVAEKLEAAGYRDAASIRAASDEELREVDGIGAATLRKVRAVVGVDPNDAA